MRKTCLYLLALILFFDGRAALGQTIKLNFEDLPRLVKEQNLHAKGATLIKEGAKSQLGHVGRSYLPQLSVSAGSEASKTGPEQSRQELVYGTDLSVNLYRGGRDSLEELRLQEQLQLSESEAQKIIQYEIWKSRTAYWSLIASCELQDTVQAAIKRNRENLESAEQRIAAGIATETDKLEFELHQIELEKERARAENEISRYEKELVTLLGLAQGTKFSTARTIVHEHQDRLLEASLQPKSQYELLGLEAAKMEALIEGRKERSWRRPVLDAYASHKLYPYREREFVGQEDRFEALAGVQLSLPLYDGRQSEVAAQKHNFRAAALAAEYEQSLLELQTEVENAKADLKLNHGLIHTSEQAIAKARQYLSATLDEYQRGVKNSLDVLAALEKLFALQLAFIDQRKSYQLARAQLMRVLAE